MKKIHFWRELSIVFLCLGIFTQSVKDETLAQLCSTKVDIIRNSADKIEIIKRNISNSFMFDENIQRFVKTHGDEGNFEKSIRYRHANEVLTTQSGIFYNIDFYTTIYSLNKDEYISNSLHFG